ncbi:BTB/POZ domain-containing protein KCTD6-like [Branchiostoma floridae]|nr:BTB/POZ domain-containing protein KCTD6-like [Branchiostoma floridae]
MNRQRRQARSAQRNGRADDIVYLNVGGHFYTTTRRTITRYPNSRLGRMFRPGAKGFNYPRFPSLWDEQGQFVIDRDGKIFRHVLNFLRLGELVLPDDFRELDLLEKEAEFYDIQELVKAVRTWGKYGCQPVDFNEERIWF